MLWHWEKGKGSNKQSRPGWREPGSADAQMNTVFMCHMSLALPKATVLTQVLWDVWG